MPGSFRRPFVPELWDPWRPYTLNSADGLGLRGEGCEYEVLQRLADTGQLPSGTCGTFSSSTRGSKAAGWLKKIPRMVRLPSDRFTREMGGAGAVPEAIFWHAGGAPWYIRPGVSVTKSPCRLHKALVETAA